MGVFSRLKPKYLNVIKSTILVLKMNLIKSMRRRYHYAKIMVRIGIGILYGYWWLVLFWNFE